MSFLEKNKSVLFNCYPGFFEDISTADNDDLSPDDIKIEISPKGDPTLCIKGIHIHSPRDPVREGQRLMETINGESGAVVVLGFGLGYAATAATAANAANAAKPIIIIEKYKSLFLKALELRDFSGFFSENKVILIIGNSGEGITSALGIADELISDEKKCAPSVIKNKALTGLDEQWYKSVEDKIRSYVMKDDVNTATHKRFGRRWIRNLSRNMSAIRDLPGVSQLSGLALGVPVFLAAAGPGLDKIKPLLRDIYDRCIVVAVDTSFRFFVENNIQPDFVLVVDPQFWNSRHLDRCFCKKTGSGAILVAESAVYPPVLNLPFINKFLCGSFFPLGMFIEKQVDSKGRLGAGGSVATTAWDFARQLGSNEIWIAGLDLSFPDNKTHFRGARFEERSNSESGRFNPVEKWVVRALRDGFPFKAHSNNGGQVLTDQRLSLYAAWFENQFSKYPQVQNYSLSNDGLAIAGLKAADTDKLLALPKRRSEINSRIQAALLQIEKEFNNTHEKCERAERYEKAVSVLESGLKSIKSAAEEGAEITRRALRYPLNQTAQNKVIKELDNVMRRITESEVKEIAGFLITPIEEEKDEKDPFRAYLKSSFKLFSGIADTASI